MSTSDRISLDKHDLDKITFDQTFLLPAAIEEKRTHLP